jgi:hypothetical protein
MLGKIALIDQRHLMPELGEVNGAGQSGQPAACNDYFVVWFHNKAKLGNSGVGMLYIKLKTYIILTFTQ